MTEISQASAAAVSTINDDVDLLDLLQVVADNLRLLIVGPLVVGLLALGISFAIKPTFTATTKFLPPLPGQGSAQMMLQSLGALGGLAGAAAGVKNPNDQFIGFLESESVTSPLIDRFDLINRYDEKFKVDARKALKSVSRISAGKDGLITIEFDDTDPVFAAQVANAYVEELGKLLKRLAITEAQFRRVFFEKQLVETREKLTMAEKAIRASGVSSSVLRQSPDISIRVLAELHAKIAAQEIKLSSLRGFLNESSPEIKQAQVEMAALRTQLAKAEAAAVPSAANPDDANYIALYRNVKYFESLFEFFARQFEAAKTDEAREGAIVQIVDVAVAPEKRSKPKRGTIAVLSTLATGALLLIFVFVRQSYRGANNDPASAQKIGHLRRSLSTAVGLN